MGPVRAFLMAIDQYLETHSRLPASPFSESGVKLFAESLKASGVPGANVEFLLGHAATKTVLESRLRRLSTRTQSGETLVVVVSTHGLAGPALATWDTQPNDLAETSLGVVDLLKALESTPAARILVLFDGQGWPEAELAELFQDSTKLVGILAASEDDDEHRSAQAAALKSSLFLALASDAFAGRTTKALTPAGHLTARTLFHAITDELPRLLRKHFDSNTHQTPHLLGEQNADDDLLDLSHLLGGDVGGLLRDPARLLRVSFRTENLTRVKDLTNFRKGFQLPDSASPSSRKFMAKIASADVKTDLDEIHDAIREAFGYKRKDIDVTCGTDGIGQIRTPDFEYTITAALDSGDPTRIKWTRELSRLADIGFVRSTGFETVFGKSFDQFLFSFSQALDLEKLIDRLEDQPIRGLKLTTATDGDSVDLTLAGFTGRLTVNRFSLIVQGRTGPTTGLLDLFLAFLTHVGPLGEPLMLKSAK
ncbi:MAG: hypothetical protein ACRC8S_22860 [Fimbriiglobus sp.]